MAKTQDEVIEAAFRRLGLKAEDQALTADEEAYGRDILAGLFQEMQNTHSLTITWTLDTTPDNVYVPLANWLAVEIAPAYSIAPRDGRGVAVQRVMAALRADDRADFRDLDDSGTVDADEVDAGDRAAFY